ncbi:hypothetical protein AB1N83_008095 [Pleurotus pulmonarius]
MVKCHRSQPHVRSPRTSAPNPICAWLAFFSKSDPGPPARTHLPYSYSPPPRSLYAHTPPHSYHPVYHAATHDPSGEIPLPFSHSKWRARQPHGRLAYFTSWRSSRNSSPSLLSLTFLCPLSVQSLPYPACRYLSLRPFTRRRPSPPMWQCLGPQSHNQPRNTHWTITPTGYALMRLCGVTQTPDRSHERPGTPPGCNQRRHHSSIQSHVWECAMSVPRPTFTVYITMPVREPKTASGSILSCTITSFATTSQYHGLMEHAVSFDAHQTINSTYRLMHSTENPASKPHSSADRNCSTNGRPWKPPPSSTTDGNSSRIKHRRESPPFFRRCLMRWCSLPHGTPIPGYHFDELSSSIYTLTFAMVLKTSPRSWREDLRMSSSGRDRSLSIRLSGRTCMPPASCQTTSQAQPSSLRLNIRLQAARCRGRRGCLLSSGLYDRLPRRNNGHRTMSVYACLPGDGINGGVIVLPSTHFTSQVAHRSSVLRSTSRKHHGTIHTARGRSCLSPLPSPRPMFMPLLPPMV